MRPPGASQRAARSRKSAVRSRSTWLSQNPANSAPAGSPSGAAHASRTWRWARRPWASEALASALEGGRRRVGAPQLALAREQRRPPAGAGGELDDPAAHRQAVEPAAGRVELGVPGRVVDRSVLVATAAQIPVVVLAGARLVVVDHLPGDAGPLGRPAPRRAPIGRGGRRRARGRRSGRRERRRRGGGRPRLEGRPQPEPEERVVAGLAETVRTELGPAFEIVRATRLPGLAAPQAGEAGSRAGRRPCVA